MTKKLTAIFTVLVMLFAMIPTVYAEECAHTDLDEYARCKACGLGVCPDCRALPSSQYLYSTSAATCEAEGTWMIYCKSSSCCAGTNFTAVQKKGTVPALGHIDEDNDHYCDRCEASFCKDENPADHKCDICKTVLTECLDESPADHKCDICKKVLSECLDESPADHKCDICDAVVSQCKDAAPPDYICDICGKEVSEHTTEGCTHIDIDNYRICGNCKQPVCPKCNGTPGVYQVNSEPTCERNGLIVMGCVCQITPVTSSIPALGHVDADKDHNCDRCGNTCCTDDTPADHKCDICQTVISECKDENPADHKCDICKKVLSKCRDESPVDHKCDICKKVLTECRDESPADHQCDICQAVISECKDENPVDQKCDICGGDISEQTCTHISINNYRICSRCKKPICPKCNGVPDIYRVDSEPTCEKSGLIVMGCVCQITPVTSGIPALGHMDADNDHICDRSACKITLSECSDANPKDHKCDTCSKVLSEHTGGTATCTDKAVCDHCEEAYGELNAANHTGEAVYSKTATQHEKKWTCCGASVVSPESHEWENGTCKECGHICDHTGGTATCKDKAVCDYCGESYSGLNAANHTGEAVYSKTATQHEKKWTCCGASVVSPESHEWENGTCKECGHICDHTGGTATCKDKAVCDYCGESYNELDAANHTGEAVYIKTATQHEKKWNCCGASVVSPESHEWENGTCKECGHICDHTGGTATCTDKAVCEYCGESYSGLNAANHTGEAVYIKTATQHEKKWTCCGASVVSLESHEWESGTCKECGYTCEHTGGTATCKDKAVCDYCGESYDELDAANHTGKAIWTKTATTHEKKWNCCGASVVSLEKHEWENGTCKECGHICEHTGGGADCTRKAVCEVCGEAYGEVDSSKHTLEKISEKAATVTETGNTEYWHCKDCGKYFSDRDGKNKTELKDTVIEKLPPEIIEDKGQSITAGEKKALAFPSNAAFGDFIRVELDGKTLDEKNYTVKEGSTIVTLKADYVATLSVGEHTIGIVSANGTATTTFIVNAKAAADNDTKSPQPEDNSHMALWIALLFVGGAGVIGTTVYVKKKRAK